MNTTKTINVDLGKREKPLKQITTRDVEVKYIDTKERVGSKIMVSTRSLANFERIQEKKRRDEIMAQNEAFKAKKEVTPDEEKKLAMKEKMKKVRAAKGKKK